MSCTIKLYNNSSDINVVSKYLTQISENITGVFKETTSILRPTIKIKFPTIESESETVSAAGVILSTCNYFYVEEFARYYFMDDIKVITNDIFEISGHVDVLQTYGPQIKACSGIIARQENDWNLYLDDGSFKTYNNPWFKIETFDSGFDALHFVLAVAGNS